MSYRNRLKATYAAYVARFDQLRRVAAGLGLDVHDAEDALQDVYLQMRRNPPHAQTDAEAFRWLMRVTVNRCLLEHRQRKQRRRLADDVVRQAPGDLPGVSAVGDNSERGERQAAVRDALQDLSPELLTTTVLHYFCGLSAAETAKVLETPMGTIHRRLHDARLRLADGLRRQGVTS